jgi:uncharacterized sporulation protein YeaH/YhbH (DUF444 family)
MKNMKKLVRSINTLLYYVTGKIYKNLTLVYIKRKGEGHEVNNFIFYLFWGSRR